MKGYEVTIKSQYLIDNRGDVLLRAIEVLENLIEGNGIKLSELAYMDMIHQLKDLGIDSDQNQIFPKNIICSKLGENCDYLRITWTENNGEQKIVVTKEKL